MMLELVTMFIFALGIPSSKGWHHEQTYGTAPPRPVSQCQLEGSSLLAGRCVLFSDALHTWDQAHWYCNNAGLRLVEITSGQLYGEIVTEIWNKGLNYDSFWIGLRKHGYGYPQWRFESGNSVHDAYWSPLSVPKRLKEPVDDPRKQCGLLEALKNHFHAAANCQEYHKFICEGPAMLSHDVSTTTKQPPHPLKTEKHPKVIFAAVYYGDNATMEKPYNDQQQHYTCPEGWTMKFGSCYLVYKEMAAFAQAADSCKKYGDQAHLATITSEEENKAIVELISSSSDNYWIGLMHDGEKLEYINGESYSYANWYFGGEPTMRSCAALIPAGFWIANNCAEQMGYICETPTLTAAK